MFAHGGTHCRAQPESSRQTLCRNRRPIGPYGGPSAPLSVSASPAPGPWPPRSGPPPGAHSGTRTERGGSGLGRNSVLGGGAGGRLWRAPHVRIFSFLSKSLAQKGVGRGSGTVASPRSRRPWPGDRGRRCRAATWAAHSASGRRAPCALAGLCVAGTAHGGRRAQQLQHLHVHRRSPRTPPTKGMAVYAVRGTGVLCAPGRGRRHPGHRSRPEAACDITKVESTQTWAQQAPCRSSGKSWSPRGNASMGLGSVRSSLWFRTSCTPALLCFSCFSCQTEVTFTGGRIE